MQGLNYIINSNGGSKATLEESELGPLAKIGSSPEAFGGFREPFVVCCLGLGDFTQ